MHNLGLHKDFQRLVLTVLRAYAQQIFLHLFHVMYSVAARTLFAENSVNLSVCSFHEAAAIFNETFQPVRLTGGWPPRQMPQQNLRSIAGCMVQS